MILNTILIIPLVLDSLVVSFAYQTNHIQIPLVSKLILSLISALFLALSFIFSHMIIAYVDHKIFNIVGCLMLGSIGLFNIIKPVLKHSHFIQKHPTRLLTILIDEIKADQDNSKILNINEAIILGISLSIDSLILGLGMANITNHLLLMLMLFLFNLLALVMGEKLSQLMTKHLNFELSWIGGIILIICALVKGITN